MESHSHLAFEELDEPAEDDDELDDGPVEVGVTSEGGGGVLVPGAVDSPRATVIRERRNAARAVGRIDMVY